MMTKMKTKNIYGRSICQHCVELGVKEERKRILEIIDIMRKDLNNPDYSYSNEWIENFLEGLKAKLKGEK